MCSLIQFLAKMIGELDECLETLGTEPPAAADVVEEHLSWHKDLNCVIDILLSLALFVGSSSESSVWSELGEEVALAPTTWSKDLAMFFNRATDRSVFITSTGSTPSAELGKFDNPMKKFPNEPGIVETSVPTQGRADSVHAATRVGFCGFNYWIEGGNIGNWFVLAFSVDGKGTCAVEVVGANEVAGSFLIPGCRRGSLRQLSCCHRFERRDRHPSYS
ncbi:hypothetical protein V6N12_056232 [Hibiscus sabdariffa]|uniref:Uncharacterized protein n=1 Tax=Hibiscus sabdariffa TaxID=183260 RepID=A0ABR2CSK6_9ROSI